MLSKSKIPILIALLKSKYGEVTCALDHRNAFELIVATILSAQCTDKRVNMVTPTLFARYPMPEALAIARTDDVEEIVRSTGFYRNKAKNIIAMAQQLVAKHGSKVPRSMEELVELPGVARKTANVTLGVSFNIASGVVVDTHVARLSRLLGLTESDDPTRIEQDLMRLIPKNEWILFGHMLIHHGREVCIARRPKCDDCLLNGLCPSAFVAPGYKTGTAGGDETKGARGPARSASKDQGRSSKPNAKKGEKSLKFGASRSPRH